MREKPTNEEIAGVLDQIANLLEAREANPFRIRSYREGAETIRKTKEPVAGLIQQGNIEAVTKLPNIGEGLAGVIEEYIRSGKSDLLTRLKGEVSPEKLFAQVPGIGQELAQHIVNQLHIDSLEELEQAAYDGRLDQVEGFGPQRVETIRVSLAGLLSGAAQRRIREAGSEEGIGGGSKAERPSVSTLLEVDTEYRRQAEAGKLQKIAPKRFNPDNEAWLPILHTKKEGWTFTALYSNTARAHELGTTHDWVVIYFKRPGMEENQSTVVTETSGPLKGKRVVRGRKAESQEYYGNQS